MKISYQQFSLPGKRPGPGGQWLALLLGAVVLVSALVLGFILFAMIFALLVFAWIGLSVRRWWQSDGAARPQAGSQSSTAALEGEFSVLDTERADDISADPDRQGKN